VPTASSSQSAGPAAASGGRKRRGDQRDLVDLDTSAEAANVDVLETGKIARPPNPWPAPPCALTDMRLERVRACLPACPRLD
jgi:hypothetical protein